jgi:molecular chaperone GrpE
MNEPERNPAGNGGSQAQPEGGAPGTVPQQAANEAAALGSATVSDVERDLQAALAKAAESQELYLRARAETDNVRRRSAEEVSKAHKFAVESFAEALVPVIDSLEKALEVKDASADQLRAGVEITLKQLRAAFEKNKLSPIDPQGQKFDPHQHQAISMVAAEGVPPNHVVAVLQKGWLIADRVLRPALVTVAQS